MTAVLELNACHDVVAHALLIDGKLVAEAEEKRFSRVKHCAGFPALPDITSGIRSHDEDLVLFVAQRIAGGGGWFQGRMEFGAPRPRQPLDRRRPAES